MSGPPDASRPEPTPQDDPLVARDLAGWARRIRQGVRRSGRRLLALQGIQLAVQLVLFAAVLLPLALSGTFAMLNEDGTPRPPPTATLVGYAVALLVVVVLGAALAAWGYAAALWVIVGDAFEEPVGVFAALRLSRHRVLPLLGWGVLSYLAVGVVVGVGWLVTWLLGRALFGSVGLTVVLGLVLVVAPLAWLGVIFGAALPGTVIMEHRDPGRCFELVTRRWWSTLGRLALAGLAFAVLLLLLGLLQGLLAPVVIPRGNAAVVTTNIGLTVVQLAAGLAVSVVACVVSAVTYAELRGHWDRTTTCETLAGDLGL